MLLFDFRSDEARVPAEDLNLFFIPMAGLFERVQPLSDPQSAAPACNRRKTDLVALQELRPRLFGSSDVLMFAKKILNTQSDLPLSTEE